MQLVVIEPGYSKKIRCFFTTPYNKDTFKIMDNTTVPAALGMTPILPALRREPTEPLGHPRVVHLVELVELVRMLKLDMESHSSRARSLPITVWTLIPLHLDRQGNTLANSLS